MGIVNLFCRNPELKSRLENTRPRLYRLAYSWCHDPYLADDLVQETLSKGLKNLGKLRKLETLESWLFTILTNTWRSHLRAKKEHVEYNEESFHDDSTPEQVNSRFETINSVQLAIGQLGLGQRQVVTLVDLEGFSYAEVAEILGIPIGTVMSRLCRARQALKESLLENASENGLELKLVKIK